MINLSNHSCYHCEHLTRKERTRHGWLIQQYKFYDEKLASLVESGKFGMVSYYRRERDRVFEAMRKIEQGQYRVVDSYRKPSITWYEKDE